ncbi:hypothetical protein N7478_008852 [Penicillium angulare]|uniref:uncharacterized protein n=1 Tax=Penicillium angulare TaxID=116970 RepID=UPI00253F8451|nr:uncharacterized protein N7478_008852 [Penicillium angulare]KAJ5273727.1 hypothetical protein N7478_008852 [Penicillium angulare]
MPLLSLERHFQAGKQARGAKSHEAPSTPNLTNALRICAQLKDVVIRVFIGDTVYVDPCRERDKADVSPQDLQGLSPKPTKANIRFIRSVENQAGSRCVKKRQDQIRLHSASRLEPVYEIVE